LIRALAMNSAVLCASSNSELFHTETDTLYSTEYKQDACKPLRAGTTIVLQYLIITYISYNIHLPVVVWVPLLYLVRLRPLQTCPTTVE
jgi:hypothetical protein